MALAILCSGQGRQHPDMFALTGGAPEAAKLFEHAAKLLGSDPRDFVRNETGEALHRNRAGQILCTVQALAAAAALKDAMPARLVVAGYSVGEVAAWGIGGLLSAADTLDLVTRRAEAMDAATQPGDGLMFVRGLAPRRHRSAVRAVRRRGRHRQSGRRFRDWRRPCGAASDRRRSKGDARRQGGGSAGGGRFPYAAARCGFCGISRELAPDVSDIPAGRRHARPERNRWRASRLGRGRPRQAGGATIANSTVGGLSARVHRSRRHGFPGTRAGACAERDGGRRLSRYPDAITGRFQEPPGRALLAGALRRSLVRAHWGWANSFCGFGPG